MDPEILQKLKVLEEKIEETTKISRQLRKYFLWMLIISLGVVVFPALGLVFLIPQIMGIYSSYSGLGL